MLSQRAFHAVGQAITFLSRMEELLDNQLKEIDSVMHSLWIHPGFQVFRIWLAEVREQTDILRYRIRGRRHDMEAQVNKPLQGVFKDHLYYIWMECPKCGWRCSKDFWGDCDPLLICNCGTLFKKFKRITTEPVERKETES